MRIEINPIACEAHGLCAELLPERVTLDEWGYPVVDGQPIPPALEDLARRAARACPTLAIRLRADHALNVSTRRTAGAGPRPPRDRPAAPPAATQRARRPRADRR
jgi:ferredoxin